MAIKKTSQKAVSAPALYEVGDVLSSSDEISGVPKGTTFKITEVKKGGIYRAKWTAWIKNGEEFLVQESACHKPA